MGRDEEALRILPAILDVHPHDYYVLRIIIYCCSTSGRGDLAVSAAQQILAEAKNKTSAKGILAFAYAISGASEDALRIIQELREDAEVQPDIAYYTALTYTKVGMNDEAFRWLEKLHEARLGIVLIIAVEPAFASLRSDPRFQAC